MAIERDLRRTWVLANAFAQRGLPLHQLSQEEQAKIEKMEFTGSLARPVNDTRDVALGRVKRDEGAPEQDLHYVGEQKRLFEAAPKWPAFQGASAEQIEDVLTHLEVAGFDENKERREEIETLLGAIEPFIARPGHQLSS